MGSGAAAAAAALPAAPPTTTPAEVRAWYAIDWSNSVYATVGVGGFLPLLLQSSALAAAGFPARCGNVVTEPALLAALFNGTAAPPPLAAHFLPDHAPPPLACAASAAAVVAASCVGGYCPGLPPTPAACRLADGLTPQQLAVGWGTEPTAFATLSLGLATLAQAAVFVALAGAADYGRARKSLLIGSGVAGGALCVACAAVGPATWWLGGVLMAATNVCFGLSGVAYNAYLPLLVRSLPEEVEVATTTTVPQPAFLPEEAEVAGAARRRCPDDAAAAATLPPPPPPPPPPVLAGAGGAGDPGGGGGACGGSSLAGQAGGADVARAARAARRYAAELAASERLSSRGFAWGYAAGVLGIGLSLPLMAALPSELAAYRGAMVLTGLWWAAFTLVPARWLRARPGPPLPGGASALAVSLAHTRATLSDVTSRHRLPTTGWFLLVWMVGSDGVFSIGTLGGLYANTHIQWGGDGGGACRGGGLTKQLGIVLMFLLTPLAAAAGSVGYSLAVARWGLPPRTALLASMLATAAIALYALGAGLSTGGEMLAVACWYGLHIGAYQAQSRALFATLLPPGRDAAFFSLYELTNKGSSALGPFVLAAIQQGTGDLRWGFAFIALSILLPAYGLTRLDLARGAATAAALDGGGGGGGVEPREEDGRTRGTVARGALAQQASWHVLA